MKKMEYKSEVIGITMKGKKSFNEAFQALLDERAEEGWRLHSYHFAAGEFCSAVFEREREEK